MKLTPASIPPNIAAMMKPEDRAKMGVMTLAEANEKQVIRYERELHSQIINLVRLRGWECVHAPTHKRSQLPEGFPDLTILCSEGRTIFFECKMGKEKLDPEQVKWEGILRALGFPHYVIRSVQEAKEILDQLTSSTP